MSRPPVPAYDGHGLAGVLPRVLDSLGVTVRPVLTPALPPARSAVVVLVDGMGLEALRIRGGHTPYLRRLLAAEHSLDATAGFPATTATSMGSFGTGLPPGQHGLVGYIVRDPARDLLFNELDWVDGPDPLAWQPHPTAFETAARAGVEVTMVGADYFDGSGLTRAALRGARMKSAFSLADRVDLTLAALRRSTRSLVYLYWGELDRVGHTSGWRSLQWIEELERIDAELGRLGRSLPGGTSLTVTADHGMVDVPFERRLDLAADPDLADGVETVGGEFRALHLYTRAGAAAQVALRWRSRLGDDAWVLEREEAVAAGLFGPVADRVRDRIGDVVTLMRGDGGIYDSRTAKPALLRLIGQHGSLTPDELLVPVLHAPA